MQEFKLKLGDKKSTKTILCKSLNVRDGMEYKGRVSRVLAEGLKAALGQDISEVFKSGINSEGLDEATTTANIFTNFAIASVDFRLGIDWEEFMELVIDSCEMCQLKTKDFVEPLKVDDLSFPDSEHYKIFGWFLECQLGNFIAWSKLKPLILEQFKMISRGGSDSSIESEQT